MGLTPSSSRIQHPLHVASTTGKLNQRAEEVSMTIQRLRSRVYGILHTSYGIFSSVGTLRTPVREPFSYGIQHISLWFNEVWPYASLNHNDICCIPYENASRTGVRGLPNVIHWTACDGFVDLTQVIVQWLTVENIPSLGNFCEITIYR